MHDVIIVGGGAVGLSVALELARYGNSVLILDRGVPEEAASWAAAGMIAPQTEAFEQSPFFDLCLASSRLYPEWTARLQEDSGIDPEFARSGVLFLASTNEEMARLTCMVEWQTKAGLRALVLSPAEALRQEPNLTLPVAGAAWLPDEAQVTPRKLLSSLHRACVAHKVETRTTDVLSVERQGARAVAVKTSIGTFPAAHIVIASGVSSTRLQGLSPAIPVSPRKGQILSLAVKASLFGRMIRWESAYIVTRAGGELIVGATNEDAGFDRSLTPEGVGGLLQKAQQIASSLGKAEIRDMWTGLRPASPDGFPIVGKSDLDGLIYATGHYRNGILLAPMTAVCVAALIENRPGPVSMELSSPQRFGA